MDGRAGLGVGVAGKTAPTPTRGRARARGLREGCSGYQRRPVSCPGACPCRPGQEVEGVGLPDRSSPVVVNFHFL